MTCAEGGKCFHGFGAHLMKEGGKRMMVDWRQILKKADGGRGGVLVTLVGVRGSSYRRVGARLLVGGEGTAGSISGGCLEGELVHRAKWLVEKGPMVQHYSTSFEDTEEIPYGLGCGGELDLLLEDVNSVEVQRLFAEVQQVFGGVRRRVVTWLPGEGRPLRRAIFSVGEDEATELIFSSEGMSADELVAPSVGMPDGTVGAPCEPNTFVETLEPPQRLVVFGAGEDARPLVTMGALLGWNVVVADGRRQLARRERFPEAERVVVLEDGEPMELREDDAVVVMTHSYEQDRATLETTLPRMPKYLGLLGARHRSSLLVSEAADRLGWSVAQCCDRLYAPVGLDLGGDGAEAIALAVVAEIQACVQGKVGLSRRLRPEDVTEQVRRGDASKYLQAQCALGAV